MNETLYRFRPLPRLWFCFADANLVHSLFDPYARFCIRLPWSIYRIVVGSGGRIRTCDLLLMRETSCLAAITPRHYTELYLETP